MKRKLNLLAVIAILFSSLAVAQEKAPENWFNLDLGKDGVQGVSTERTYMELLNGVSPKQMVVVAVIDSGVDTDHEDLKDVMWINPNEIAGNGIDDDNNGYIDDIHGWNFIGGKDGSHVSHDNLEAARLTAIYRKQFAGRTSSAGLSKKEKKQWDEYQVLEALITKEQKKGKESYENYSNIITSLNKLEEMIENEPITLGDLTKLTLDDPQLQRAATIATNTISGGGTFEGLKEDLDGALNYFESKYKYHYNPDFDSRSTIVKDNYQNSLESNYGNNDVEGPDASHGTHVAGIIAASRGNDVGMKGVSGNVRIMSIRAVPDGDERDKDVANAIRYAVDNGASIINMSFGKGYSYDKGVVDAAMKYAQKNDVLLVHAAGNSSQNNDNTGNFPNDRFEKTGWFRPKKLKNWLEVGALSWKGEKEAPAKFSNFGKENVDLFAPGVDIYSTIPGSKYANFNGTSMASPVVAGVAAVLRSYFPELSAKQVRSILMDSTFPINRDVNKPGTEEVVPFSQLSVTGGVVNTYTAVAKAKKTKGKKKKWKTSKQAKASGLGPKGDTLKRAYP